VRERDDKKLQANVVSKGQISGRALHQTFADRPSVEIRLMIVPAKLPIGRHSRHKYVCQLRVALKIRGNHLRRLIRLFFGLFISILTICAATRTLAEPLRPHPGNPRYFTDGSSKAIYLTGWNHARELQDNAWTDYNNTPTITDYPGFLKSLKQHNHNYMRLWVVEHTKHTPADTVLTSPMPYLRTGPTNANDGQPKFDLDQLNEAYFDRLRSRVIGAGEEGIYVSVMLFQGWSVDRKEVFGSIRNPWPYHPFHENNNVNGINGDSDGNDQGEEVHTLQNSTVTKIQENYVKKVIDTLNDLDNVLYEIANEGGAYSKDWLYHIVRFIKGYQAVKPKQHPVGITAGFFSNSVLTLSAADWISPGGEPHWVDDPPVADGAKVSITDTDHIVASKILTSDLAVGTRWVWKSFMRGHNPSLLARLTTALGGAPEDRLRDNANFELIRKTLGLARSYSQRIDLAAMIPRKDLASSGYALAKLGVEYLVYLPGSRNVTVDLSESRDIFKVEWGNTTNGDTVAGGTVTGGARRDFTAPYDTDSILHLKMILDD
jgi:hypothetical protein